jgi:hypothetical protein
MAMTIRDVFDRGTDAFNAHDIDAFAALLADDVLYSAPGGVHGRGKAGCAATYRAWIDAFSDARVEVDSVYIVDDVVVEQGTFVGTHDGVLRTPAGDIPPTGRPVRCQYVHVLRIRDGKHVSFDLTFDRLQMLEQLGVVPAAEAAA